jgi:nitrite reductase/ring-hydroxylating ferredoxin subunit
MRYELFPAQELQPGDIRAVDVGGASVVVLCTPDGRIRALRNHCSHHGAPLSGGTLQPVVTGDDVGRYEISSDQFMLRCPWHGYEFDVDTGRCLADPRNARVKAYDVTIIDGTVCIER